ncbi:major facilitator superfamily transporter [Fusarium tjaetaba]|uniref:Major facilitator superfamily transporter n=1 Tax=Fusarium tjaetaba TaxID=1567544 RepID=A0A8H5S6J6_9HYPO|nr:major facilitator superfamily transporter [Fusarium tjaetaba]KAF5646959.1 major facilitator superfamily transporter [Fusarium tjaetaba]
MAVQRTTSHDSSTEKEYATHVEGEADMEEYVSLFPLLANKSLEERQQIETKLKRKLDWAFLPVVTLMLLMGYLDRINVANARLAGMQDDLHMSDTMWSAGISLFYVGYIVTQLPATVYLAKGLPRWQMPAYVIAWSVITACMAAMTSGWSFLVCRFMVGVAEGPFLPMVSLMTSSWYTKEEAPLRMAIWHAGNIASNIFSGLLAAGILENMNGLAGMRAWQWFVIIEGIVGLFVAIMGFWCIPNFPHNTGTYFMTAEMSEMAQYRMVVSAGGRSEDDEGGAWEGVKLACKDPFTWIYTVLHFGLIVALSFKDFFPSIVKTLGYSNLMTYLIQAPPYIFAYLATCVISWSWGRHMEHCWHIIGSTVACIVGVVIMISTLNAGARYFGMFLLCAGPFVGLNIHIPWETTNVARPRTKRGALVAITNCIASVSHWFTPYFFLRSQEPRYQNGGILIIAGCVMGIAGCLVCKWYVKRLNKKMDEHEAANNLPKRWRQPDVFAGIGLVGISVFQDHLLPREDFARRHNPRLVNERRSRMLACTLCHNRKVRCEVDAESNTCITCKAAGVECIPRTRKRRRGGAAPMTQQLSNNESHNYSNQQTQHVSQSSGAGIVMPMEHASYQTPSTTQSTTYIGRGHYVTDDDEIDETSARAFAPAKIKVGPHASTQRETLVLWKALDIPPLAARQSLLSAFLDYCNLWTPVLEQKDIHELSHFEQEPTSLLLAQSLWLAGSRVTSSPSVVAFASSDDFYHRAKTVFWSGVETDGLSAIKASLMLQWTIEGNTTKAVVKFGDSLISVAHGRPRVINLDDSDVQPPIPSDFPDSQFAFQLFSAWVDICQVLGDISSCCIRRHMSRTKRLYIESSLYRWATSLPQDLQVAPSNQSTHGYLATSQNLPARQLYLPYFTSLIVFSRMQPAHSGGSATATLAASFVARIFEDFLARDEIKVLAPISTRYCLISSMALVSVMPNKRLWDAVQPDLEILQLALAELSKRWRSAIGASRALQNAINKRQQRAPSSTAHFRVDYKGSLEYFKMIDLGYCRIWSTISQQMSSGSSPMAAQEQIPEPVPLPGSNALATDTFMDPGEALDMGAFQFEHV